MPREDKRKPGELRPVSIRRKYTTNTPGSVLIDCGRTRVLCTATFQASVPKWREGSGLGWVTAEYDMLPGSTFGRKPRNRSKIDGRTAEIQRLIGRSLRAVIDYEAMGENSILLDCDVLQADGGTRTASITGAYVAMHDAVTYGLKEGFLEQNPIIEPVAAVSAGKVKNQILLDLAACEDQKAEVDTNVVMTGSGKFIEVQGTGEGSTFDRTELDKMLNLAARGIRKLIQEQKTALAKRNR